MVVDLRKKDLDNSSIGVKETLTGSKGSGGGEMGDILGFVNKIDGALNMVGDILNKVEGLKNRIVPQPTQQTHQIRPATREVAIVPAEHRAPPEPKKEELKQEMELSADSEGLEVEDMAKIGINAEGFLEFLEGMLEKIGDKKDMTIEEVKEKISGTMVRKFIISTLKDNEKMIIDSLIVVKE